MKIRKKYLFYALAFSSALIGALISSLDTVIVNKYIFDPWAYGFSCFIVGLAVTFLLALIFSIPIHGKSLGSRFVDPSFERLRFVRRVEVKYHVFAGIGNSILTVGYLHLLSMLGDPSTVLPFSQIVILYLVVIESFVEKNIPTLPEVQSSIIVTFGAMLGSISLTGTITLDSMFLVFVVISPAWVLFSIYQRKLKMLRVDNKSNDSVNIRFWNVVFSFFFSALFIFLYDVLTGSSHFIAGFTASYRYFNWVALVMIIAFFSYVFYIRALGIGKASVTQAVRASTIFFIIPFSVLLAYLNVIPMFVTTPVMIVIKIMGVILVFLGIASFALTLVKAYIFIRMKPGYPIEETMQKLWDIPGVTHVTAVAGTYDFIVKIRIRTLVKGYENIIRRIEEIKGIREYRWNSVLKEWEEI